MAGLLPYPPVHYRLALTRLCCACAQTIPEERQTLLFSATLPRMLAQFARAGLRDPTLIRLDMDSKVSEQLCLGFFHVRSGNKNAALLYLLREVRARAG